MTRFGICIGEKYAIKAIQKKKVKDFMTFQNEIKLLRVLVNNAGYSLNHSYRITLTLSSCMRSGNGMMCVSWYLSK